MPSYLLGSPLSGTSLRTTCPPETLTGSNKKSDKLFD